MNHQYDCLVIGAGLAGSVAARELAERGGKRVLVLERRNHVGGNAYDCFDEAGVLIHQYGPHIFHTNSTRVFDYLSRFTRWRPYEHQVVANLPDGDGRLEYPVPFNLVSLRAAFPPEKARALRRSWYPPMAWRKRSPFWSCGRIPTRSCPPWPTMCMATSLSATP